jgi:hypothetical protein
LTTLPPFVFPGHLVIKGVRMTSVKAVKPGHMSGYLHNRELVLAADVKLTALSAASAA